MLSPLGGSKPTDQAQPAEITLDVDTNTDTNDSFYMCTNQPDDCSLRGAITHANWDADVTYVIRVPAGTYRLALEGVLEDGNTSGDLDLYGHITLQGQSAEDTILEGIWKDRVLDIHPGARVELLHITVQGGQAPHGATPGADGEHGGGILNRGELVIRDSVIRDNRAGDGAPGAIDGDLDIDGGDAGSGGGIYNLGTITIVDSTVINNLAGIGGDGTGSCFMITCPERCSYAGDGGSGGGIFNKGILDLESSLIMSNAIGQAGRPGECAGYYEPVFKPGTNGMGGGVYNQRRVEASSSTIIGNEGGGGGGGFDNHGAAFLTDCSIFNNRGDGGGGFSNHAEAVLESCYLEGNSGGNGGGIFNNSDLLVKELWIRNNNAAFGGGLYNDGSATVVDTQITHNVTREGEAGSDGYLTKGCIGPTPGETPSGGGVFNAGGMIIDHSQISENSSGNGGRGGNGMWCHFGYPIPGADGGAGGYGGGIYNTGSLELNLSSVDRNTTGNGGMGGGGGYGDGNQGRGGAGGGVYNSGTMRINLDTLLGNQTGQGSSGGQGGAIANEGQLFITGGTIRDNRTSQDGNGGGIYASSPITISATTVISNTASGSGGGLVFNGIAGQVENSIIGGNVSEDLGSGLYASGSMLDLESNTIAQNYGGDGSGLHAISSTLHLTNTILVSHTVGVMVEEDALVEMNYTLWGSGVWANQLDWAGAGTIITGTHNYWEEPGFLDPSGLDYHIISASAAIDRGVNNGLNGDIDFQPRPNPASQLVDLGADEYWIATPIETVSITSQLTITRTAPISLTATIFPDTATPNILYYWRPPPVAGQWTESALYAWQMSGVEKVTVMAINAASAISDTITITVEPVYSLVYLPVIRR
jgi:hypothetical protein